MLSKERNQAEPSGAAKAGVKSLPLPGASLPAVSGPLHGEGTGVFGLQMVKRSLLWERPAHGLVARGEALAGGPGSQACGDSSELTAESGHLCKRSLQPWLTLDFLWTHLQDDPCHRAICLLPCTPFSDLLTAPHCRLPAPWSCMLLIPGRASQEDVSQQTGCNDGHERVIINY